jgi:NAD(P)-dependent dehydrogenase (short-subunit alcohol dehydrogenase family)
LINDTVDERLLSFEANSLGSFLVARVLLSKAVLDATVVNIASTTAHRHGSNFPGVSAYTASKIATTRLFDYIQMENPGLCGFNIPPA